MESRYLTHKQANANCYFRDKNALYNTISTIGLTLDHEGTLWIANNNSGACAYHFDSQKFSIYKHKNSNKHSLSSNSINSIYEDSQKGSGFVQMKMD